MNQIDICFRCLEECTELHYRDEIGNPLCETCVDSWDLAGRPAWFLDKPLPTAIMVIHWMRPPKDSFYGDAPVLLGYPGYRAICPPQEER